MEPLAHELAHPLPDAGVREVDRAGSEPRLARVYTLDRAGSRLSTARIVEDACALLPPLWTLRNFVAVNPYLGLTDLAFEQAMTEVGRLFDAEGSLPLGDFLEARRRGRIREADLLAAIEELRGRPDAPAIPAAPEASMLAALESEGPSSLRVSQALPTLAEAVDRTLGTGLAQIVVEEIARFCAGRFDAGQAAWRQPGGELGPFAAWLEIASIDRGPELRGIPGFRDYVSRLPASSLDCVRHVLEQLGTPASHRRDFLVRQLTSIAGWAGHAQYLRREARLRGGDDPTLVDLLAIRLAYDGAIAAAYGDRLDPIATLAVASRSGLEAGSGEEREPLLSIEARRSIWQRAYEIAYQRTLLDRLGATPTHGASSAGPDRPTLQAVFCIDVRSEALRRGLEALSPAIETRGFAGFFGVPVEYVDVGDERGGARCPALLAPPWVARAQARVGARERKAAALDRHERFTRMRKLALGAFPLVETLGHGFGLRLLTDSLGWTRPHPGGALFEGPKSESLVAGLELEPGDGNARPGALERWVDLAEGCLRNMGLTRGFARVVLLCGHGARTTNNPYASSLDCGACGGHEGGLNARLAADLLSRPEIRSLLAARGLFIPSDTRFVAALHDTTCDRVELLDAPHLEPELRAQIEAWLEAAGRAAGEERSERFGLARVRGDARRGAMRRARDWSEVRPEWGLAGNAAFVAARRTLTRGLDLEGRAFLHDYDPALDEDGAVLEMLLTAPLVVASWINLQYFASTVDNDRFGSGDKTLHNVVSRIGVMLGSRGDLRPGLPWQSLHDGRRFVHEPMRLTAIVESPRERIDAVLAKHETIRSLVEHRFLHLIAWDPESGCFHRRDVSSSGAPVWEETRWSG